MSLPMHVNGIAETNPIPFDSLSVASHIQDHKLFWAHGISLSNSSRPDLDHSFSNVEITKISVHNNSKPFLHNLLRFRQVTSI